MTAPPNVSKPPFRLLRGFAFDPLTSLYMDTAEINQVTYKVPWEDLQPGPNGEYIKVIDRDPDSDAVYKPVNLNDPVVLGSNGLSPSETNPQFHQQMVYAVIMTTIRHFEKALGRKVIWSPAPYYDKESKKFSFKYIQHLLVYPHGFRGQNAYYSPDRKALIFGYYNATPADGNAYLPGGIVYSCLSHDIIAHEATHALIDSMYPLYMELSHPDVAGFHEGFSDLVALLQHFTYPEIVRNQISLTRGRLDVENMLVKLAVEFGQTTGEHRSLRMAIGQEVDGVWKQQTPSTTDYQNNLECHDRGALLVAAVFDAFHAIYTERTADLLRIASGGTGVMPEGALHPDLVNRLAEEASCAASHVLNMCVRALDYCPPVDLTYGDYLRALITADKELVVDDVYHYRIAFINAFRKRGIFPTGVPNMSVDTLCYSLDGNSKAADLLKGNTILRRFKEEVGYLTNREDISTRTSQFITGMNPSVDEDGEVEGFHSVLTEWMSQVDPVSLENLTGLVFTDQYKELGIRKTSSQGIDRPATWIHSMRLNNRIGPDGRALNQLVMTLVQSTTVVALEKEDEDEVKMEVFRKVKEHLGYPRFRFRGGCTLIFDLDELRLKHAISKPIFDPSALSKGPRRRLKLYEDRVRMQYESTRGELSDKIGLHLTEDDSEFFAKLHSSPLFKL